MKKANALLLAALITLLTVSGCRSKPNDNKTPSTTTVPTTMPTTMATTEAPDPTIASGNGPIDETGMTGETSTAGETGTGTESTAGTGSANSN